MKARVVRIAELFWILAQMLLELEGHFEFRESVCGLDQLLHELLRLLDHIADLDRSELYSIRRYYYPSILAIKKVL